MFALLALVAIGAVAAPRLWVEVQLYRGRSLLKTRQAEQALTCLRSAERWDPQNAEVQFLLARAQRRQGRFDLVRKHIEQAWNLGYPVEALQREQWLALAQSGQLGEAEPHLRELLTDPKGDEREICEAFVNGYCMNLRFDAALRLLEAWQADFPEDPEPHFRRGYIRQALMDAAGAVEHYRRGLELAPDRADARLRLAQVLLSLNKLAEAEKQFRRVGRQRPDDPDVQVGLATCLSQRGCPDEARRLLLDLVARRPEHVSARRLLGDLAIAEKHYDKAIQWLAPLRKTRPNDPGILMKLVKCYRARGDSQSARELLQSLKRAEHIEARLDDLIHEALENPDDADLRYQIGALLMEARLAEDAAQWLRSAVESDPGHVRAHAALAEYYTQSGNPKFARRHRRLAEELAQTSDQ